MMATKKSKPTSKTGKASESGEKVRRSKVTISNYEPGIEEIRLKAKEIYLERVARNEHGTSEEDWHKAERLLKGAKK